MTAFHTIAIPHDDILQGRLTMDVFAADLWDVFKGRGAEEYKNADLFFQKTYQTEGLSTLLDVIQKRLKGKGGDPILQVQTPFGGGKTHALIAMYHKVDEWKAKRVVMVGTAMSGTETLWGLLEEQLTGKREKFGGNISPGRTDEFRDMLEKHSPLLILMDEVLEYTTKAAGVKVGDSTLAAQTIAFMQELTEAISTLDKVALVVTLPSSHLEHFDEVAAHLFQQLQRVSGRVEKIYTPVQEHEITQVIRQRLFAHVDKKAAAKEISAFMDFANRESLLPAGVEPSEYRQRFEASYPFLPDVVDILYQRWGSFTTFQRTRGVLRLLALVIYALKDHSNSYISLADFDLGNQEIRRELLKHIGQEFDSVIGSDITGPDAGARKVNTALGKSYQGLKLGERTATSIFMYSFSGGIERGATMVEVKRNATTLSNPSSAIAEAVEESKGRQLFYIQHQSSKYFFSNQANLNRLLLTKMENIPDEGEGGVLETEETLLKARLGGARLRSYVWREQTADIPDTPELKLVVLREPDEKMMRTMLEEKGGTPRVHRNTLIFLVPQIHERPAFANLVRKFLALQALEGDQTVSLNKDQRDEIKTSLKRAKEDIAEGIRRLYRQVYLPAHQGWKEVDLGLPIGGTQSLDQEIYDRLRFEGEILEKIAPLVLREKFLSSNDWVYTAQLYQASLKTPGETRATNQNVWDTGIADGVRQGLFGLGELQEGEPNCLYFKQECSVAFTEHEVLIKANICEAQQAAQTTTLEQEGAATGAVSEPPRSGLGASTPTMFPPSSSSLGSSGQYKQLDLGFVVPKGKVSSLLGVLNYLQSRYGRIEINLRALDGELSEQEYEDKIKEAFRQMGIELE